MCVDAFMDRILYLLCVWCVFVCKFSYINVYMNISIYAGMSKCVNVCVCMFKCMSIVEDMCKYQYEHVNVCLNMWRIDMCQCVCMYK